MSSLYDDSTEYDYMDYLDVTDYDSDESLPAPVAGTAIGFDNETVMQSEPLLASVSTLVQDYDEEEKSDGEDDEESEEESDEESEEGLLSAPGNVYALNGADQIGSAIRNHSLVCGDCREGGMLMEHVSAVVRETVATNIQLAVDEHIMMRGYSYCCTECFLEGAGLALLATQEQQSTSPNALWDTLAQLPDGRKGLRKARKRQHRELSESLAAKLDLYHERNELDGTWDEAVAAERIQPKNARKEK